MNTYPLQQWSLPEAIDAQFRLVDGFHRAFDGYQALEAGDFGVPQDTGRPRATERVERVLAEFFEAEDAVLVAGAGTGAIRNSLMASLDPGSRVVVHAAPLYATTRVTFRAMGIETLEADFNDLGQLESALATRPDMVYVQHSRQRLEDSYSVPEVIGLARSRCPDAVVVVDDNYTALQVPRIGSQLGAHLSAFSLFKLLGEPGVGCIVGSKTLIDRIRDDNYSGGSKVQGPFAVNTLRGLVYAPVALAIQATVVEELVDRLNNGIFPEVERAYIANHQERAALVSFHNPISDQVVATAPRFGAVPYPVGSQSKYELSVMVYRLSRAMCENDPSLATRTIRVNPYRTGSETILRILDSTLTAVHGDERT